MGVSRPQAQLALGWVRTWEAGLPAPRGPSGTPLAELLWCGVRPLAPKPWEMSTIQAPETEIHTQKTWHPFRPGLSPSAVPDRQGPGEAISGWGRRQWTSGGSDGTRWHGGLELRPRGCDTQGPLDNATAMVATGLLFLEGGLLASRGL